MASWTAQFGRTVRIGFAGALALLLAVPAHADDDEDQRPTAAVVQQLYDCRAITDPTERLACYDRQVAALAAAEGARDVRIVDRAQVREARRGLFGFSLNLGNIFGGDDDAEEETADADAITSLDAVIAGLSTDSTGRRLFILDNDQQWVQTEGGRGRSPRVGMPITIRRAALGSYTATVDGRPAVRVMRVR